MAKYYSGFGGTVKAFQWGTLMASLYTGYQAYNGKPIYGLSTNWKGQLRKFSSKRIDPKLIEELARQNVKYNPDEMIIIGKDSSGKILWLEKGNSKAGFKHIIMEHGMQFANQGIPAEVIPDYLMEALTNGKIIGYQGRGTGRPIYEFQYNGQVRRIAITTGNNGFIVGANPVSLK